jgi:hypothetical protein
MSDPRASSPNGNDYGRDLRCASITSGRGIIEFEIGIRKRVWLTGACVCAAMIELTLEMLEMTLEITAAGDQHTVTLIP